MTITAQTGAVYIKGSVSSGQINVNGLGEAIIASHSAATGAWGGRIVSKNPTTNVAAFLGSYNGSAGLFGHNAALTAWSSVYINNFAGVSNANVYLGTAYVGNSLVLHAGNYAGYSAFSGNVSAASFSVGATSVIDAARNINAQNLNNTNGAKLEIQGLWSRCHKRLDL
jgi:hypothetical protein